MSSMTLAFTTVVGSAAVLPAEGLFADTLTASATMTSTITSTISTTSVVRTRVRS
jgi:hypothetical protein